MLCAKNMFYLYKLITSKYTPFHRDACKAKLFVTQSFKLCVDLKGFCFYTIVGCYYFDAHFARWISKLHSLFNVMLTQ